MIVVTGGAGFIGSNIVEALNARGVDDLAVVDDLTDARKAVNLATCRIADYLDRSEFAHMVRGDASWLDDVELVIHQGATSSTTHADGREVMANNYRVTRDLIDCCVRRAVPLVLASSAAVYGASRAFAEDPVNERPLNVYGLSKRLVDDHLRRLVGTAPAQLVALRYFNVYGPNEDHKDRMASLVAQLDDEIRARGTASIFGPSHGLGAGEQRRDFVYVDDVVETVLWFADRPDRSGVFNVGTGRSRTFAELASLVLDHHHGGTVRFTDFPPELAGRYQAVTEADVTRLRSVGFDREFTDLETGVARYLAIRDSRRSGGT